MLLALAAEPPVGTPGGRDLMLFLEDSIQPLQIPERVGVVSLAEFGQGHLL